MLKLRYKALEIGADIVLYGHTHIGKIDFEEGIWYINPGSASVPRDGGRSFAIINIRRKHRTKFNKILVYYNGLK